MPHFVTFNEYFEPIYKKLISTLMKHSEKMILDKFDRFFFYNREKSRFHKC